MSVPPLPSFVEVPNTLGQGLRSLKSFHRTFSDGLTNATKATKLNKFRSIATEKKAIANQKAAEIAKKNADNAKKVTDNLKKGNFKKVNGNLANAVGFALSLASIGLSLMTINHTGKLQETQLKIDSIQSRDLGDAFTRAINNTLKLNKLREDFKNFINQYKNDKDKLFAEAGTSQASATEARELSELAKKQANDALYEARTGRQKLETRITEINNFFNRLKSDIVSQNLELVNRINEARKLGNDALYEVRRGRTIFDNQIRGIEFDLLRLTNKVTQFTPGNSLRLVQNTANTALDIARSAKNDAKRALQTKAQPGSRGPQGIPGKTGARGPQGIQGLRGYPGIAGAPGKPGLDGRPGRDGIDGVDGKDGKDVNPKQYNDLIQKISLIPPLIARVPGDTVKRMPKPLTSGQIEAAASAGVCRSTRSGGCMSNALNNTANTINRNTNNWGKNLLDKINAGANAAQLALLKKIDLKMGPQVENGLSGAISRNLSQINKFANWLQLDRLLNILTWVNTTHNAYMLSSSITNTLFGAIDNISNIFFEDLDGQKFDSKKSVSIYFENMAKTIFGVENWNNITTTVKKYNRIYQAAANIANTVRSMVDSLRNISEFIAENTGKIGNALKKFGVIGEKAFPWMPENVNAQSVWVQRLENLEDAASGIEMVTSEAVSIKDNLKELTTQKEKFEKSIEDLSPQERPDNKPVKNREETEKAESQSPPIPVESERSSS